MVRVDSRWRVAIAAASMMTLTACGGAAPSPTAAPKATQPAATTSAAPAASPASSPAAAAASAAAGGPSSASLAKVNANTASRADVQQALQVNGVPNPDRWAREVEEYRPYPVNDPSLAKLRQELGKYNPAPDVLEKILSSLTL